LINYDDGRCWQTMTTETRRSTMKINEILFIYTANKTSSTGNTSLQLTTSSNLTPTSSQLPHTIPHTLNVLLRHPQSYCRCSCVSVLYIPRGRGGGLSTNVKEYRRKSKQNLNIQSEYVYTNNFGEDRSKTHKVLKTGLKSSCKHIILTNKAFHKVNNKVCWPLKP